MKDANIPRQDVDSRITADIGQSGEFWTNHLGLLETCKMYEPGH
jgi:hypothetical protein